jgi:DNA-binding NtrC family response regulator
MLSLRMTIHYINGKDARTAELRIFDEEGHIRPWAELEREVIDHALLVTGGRVVDTSAKLRIARSTLYRRREEQGRFNP